MKTRLHRLHKISVLVVVSLLCLCIAAQTPQQPAATVGTGTISGRVTSNDRPLAGIVIAVMAAQPTGAFGRVALARAETDVDGRYQLTGVPAGSYTVVSLAALYVFPGDSPFGSISGKSVTLNEGETATGIDLALIRGGVITGRVVDPDGRPLIEQLVQLERLDQNNNLLPINFASFNNSFTDDRGIYRLHSVLPGRYRISSGDGEGMVMRVAGRKSYPRTFHPDVNDAAQAKIIDLAEGGEASGIDIRLSLPARTYAIVGRAVDADTGEGVPNIRISYSAVRSDGRPAGTASGPPTGANGEFRLEGLRMGRYMISAGGSNFIVTPDGYMDPGQGNSGYSDPVPVEVPDGDVTGVELKIRRGATVSGVAVLEGPQDPAILARLSQISLFAFIRPTDGTPPVLNNSRAGIGLDRIFRFDGVRPGKLQINASISRAGEGSLTLLRIERDGAPIPDGIDVGPGEQIGGVRLVFIFGNGIVRGQVNAVNGSLPEGAILFISARRTDGQRTQMGAPARADARGQFVLEGLAAGQYEIEARIAYQGQMPPQVPRRPLPTARAPVVVANGQVQQITLTLDFAQQERRQ